MKYLKILAIVVLLCAVSAVSFSIGRSQYTIVYEDACHMADLIRCYQDHLDSEDSVIEDYGCFDELVGDFLYDNDRPVDIDKYYYCY